MLHIQRTFVLIGMLVSTCWGATSEITQLKQMHLKTQLAAGGEPRCVIAIPPGSEYAELGEKLATAIERTCGAAPPVVPATRVKKQTLETTNVIALGIFCFNEITERLYLRDFVRCDYSWPSGESCFEIRTVHNPWLTGANAIVIASPNPGGCQAAVDRFLTILAASPDGAVGPIIEIQDDRKPAAPNRPTIAGLKQSIRNETSSRTMGSTASKYCNLYFTTGDPAYAELFLEAMRKLDELQEAEGAADDVRSCRFIFHEFDRIEEGPAFNDTDRRELTNLFYRFARRLKYAKATVASSTIPHGNDWNAMGATFAGLYFSNYYPNLEIGKKILANLDVYYEPNMVSWKVNEDCPGYGKTTLTGNYSWAIHRPDPRFIKSQRLKKMVDLNLLTSNNFGEVSGFGDYNGLGSKYLVDAYPLAAWLYKDGRYLWWWDRHGGEPARFWTPPEVTPRKRPDDLLGVAKAPLDNWIYNRRSHEPNRSFPITQCYDKVTFRAGFGPEDSYVCMSGVGYGFHSHADANAIITYADKGQTFLYDHGYMIPTLSEHNTVLILKDGWAGHTPELAQVIAEADFDNTGVFSSRLNNYNGVRWDRNVIWSRSGHFLVIDDLTAVKPATYSFQNIWRALGATSLQGRRWTSEKGTSRFNLVACSNASLSQKESAGTSLNSKSFPLNEARRLVQTASVRMAPGDSHQFANCFYTVEKTDQSPAIDVYRLDKTTTYLTKDGKEISVAGVRRSTAIPGIAVQAVAFHLNGNELVAAGATSLDIDGPLLSSKTPVNVSFDLESGDALVETRKPAVVTYSSGNGDKTATLELGRHSLKIRTVGDRGLSRLSETLESTWSRLANAAAKRTTDTSASEVKIAKLWQYRNFDIPQGEGAGAGWHLNAMETADIDGDGRHEVFVGGTDNVIHAIGPGGNSLWTSATGDTINDLAVAESAGEHQVAAACEDKTLYCVAANGAKAWTVVPPPRTYARPGYRGVKPFQSRLTVVFASDIDNDNNMEFIVGSANWRTYVYDRNGELRWDEVLWAHTPTCGAAGDLDGDGRKEVIMGNSYTSAKVYSATGRLLGDGRGSFHAGPTALAGADLDGNGKGEIVVGDKAGKIWFQEWQGRDMPSWDAGSDVAAIAMADTNGDGKTESAVTSRNNMLYLFDANGQPLWQVNLLDVCRDLDIADVTGDGKPDIVCGCEDDAVKIVTAGGKIIAQFQTGGWVRYVGACELDGRAATKEIVAACDDGSVYGLQVTP